MIEFFFFYRYYRHHIVHNITHNVLSGFISMEKKKYSFYIKHACYTGKSFYTGLIYTSKKKKVHGKNLYASIHHTSPYTAGSLTYSHTSTLRHGFNRRIHSRRFQLLPLNTLKLGPNIQQKGNPNSDRQRQQQDINRDWVPFKHSMR